MFDLVIVSTGSSKGGSSVQLWYKGRRKGGKRIAHLGHYEFVEGGQSAGQHACVGQAWWWGRRYHDGGLLGGWARGYITVRGMLRKEWAILLNQDMLALMAV
mmetsp:Transcript_33609/g.45430  ORF Transcript_33609/g.45430 Transcript_33609/m.45430 type:complete len:102 (-) Transcript_33609:172-477(-)